MRHDILDALRPHLPMTCANITEAAGELNKWGPEQVVTLKCRDCGADMKVELPLNPVSFFTE